MSAGLALGVAGAVIGSFTPLGPLVGYAIGSALGSALFGPKLPAQQGPRLQDLSIQSSAEGQPIFKIYGTMRTAGNIFWGKPITEHKHTKKSGGKGGGGGQKTVTYSYTADFAIGLCEGPISAIVKIWADGKLIYDMSPLTAAEQAIVDGGGYVPGVVERFQSSFGATTNIANTGGTMRIYSGSETQLPDPLIEADLGVGNTPAYRGTAYIVFDNFDLSDFGNRIPNITAQVIADGASGIQYLGKIGPFEARAMPPGVALGDSRQQVYSHYARADKTIAVSAWEVSFADTYMVSGDPITVYPSGIVTYGVRGSLTGDSSSLTLRGYCDVPAFFTVDGPSHNAALHLYTVNGSDAPVLISTFQPDDGVGGWVGLDNSVLSGVFYVDGMIWIYRNDNGKVYSLDPGGTLAITKGTLTSLYTGALRSVFIGADEIYVLSGAANPLTLTVINKETFTVVRTASVPIAPPSAQYPIIYSDTTGVVWVFYYSAGSQVALGVMNGATWTAYGDIPSMPVSLDNIYTLSVSGGMLAVFVVGSSFDVSDVGSVHYWSLASVSSNTVPLSTIVADISNSAALNSSFIDVTDLASTMVSGYIRNAQMTARAAIEPLATGFFFDARESGTVIKFTRRGGASVATIPFDDLGANVEGQQTDRAVTTITQDNELPIELNMQYVDPARDFQVGSQRSRRQIPKSQKIDTVQMPISWSGTQAKQAVEKLHYMAWEEQTRYTFSLPIKYLRLEPADVVLLPVNGVNKRVRLTKTSLGNVLECEAVSDYAANYVSESIAADNPTGPQQISVPGTTIMQLLDIPLLQDADNNAGLYIAALGTGSGWSGASIYKSSDNVTFDFVDSITTESIMGSMSALLPTGPTTIWDDGNTITVRLIEGALTSTTDLGAMSGVNTAAIGAHGRWELVSFVTATLNGDGSYTLSRLIRGRKGTEWAVGTHAIGDAFVLLETGALARSVPATTDIGAARYYKAISFGGDESAVITYTHQAVGLECYAPVHIRGQRHAPATNDWTITFVRQGRMDNAWRDYVDIPLGEPAENYEIDIMSGSTVKRTIAATSQSAVYTSAMQTTDFGAAQTTITVNIYQLSATVGRGYVGTKTL